MIRLGTWVRPVLRERRSVLLLQRRRPGEETWALQPRAVVKSH